VIKDITERKLLEQQRLELERRLLFAQKLESLGVLAGGIAHDFNNLLMVVLGNLEMSLMELSPEASSRTGIEKAIQAAHKAADLTRQMLAYSGKGHFKVEDLNLGELLEENAGMIQAVLSKGVELEVRVNQVLSFIRADAGQIQQVVMSLITNAAEAIGEGTGVVTLSTGVEDFDGSYLKRSLIEEKPLPGRFVYLEVSDTGCGMDDTTLKRLFDPFFTTKFTGRGLGMAAVHGIVRGHKGAIIVGSEAGRGTTVRVLFPAANAVEVVAAPEAETAARGCAAEAPPLPKTVLVVDDEESVRNVCKAMVEHFDFRVFTAADGEDALRVFRERAGDIDCVILDLTMPHMDGLTAFRELRRIRPDVRVILSSGYDEQEATRHFTGQGLAGFIQKPYRIHDLQKALGSALDKG
jgi:nitrogen-specific signal transduction histidine kinase